MIDQATIDRILDVAQIVEVVSDFVTLRKRGVNYVGLCPFHNEKTPSFSVSPSKGLCKCFSCGKGGNAVHFIMEHEQMSYPEALRYLAKKYNIEIKERELTNEEKEVQSNRESMFIVNNFARDYFQNILKNHVDGRSIGLAYFRQRGFRDDIIDKFQLGFSTEGRDALAQEALRKGFKQEFLVKTGLCYETDDHKLRDRFWGRVMFPVHTLSGKVVAFGGRVLSTENKKLAKYVNSPESEIYHKSNELYGIYFAKQAIVKQDRCFLVEGYTDVISMHQSGVENVVASSGTSLTPGQIRLIHRFTNNITVLYDGDMAGIKASIRGIDMLLEEGMNIKVCLLPDGDDPDSFARKHNATEFQNFIQEHETDFIRFKAQLLMEDAGKDPMKRAELINDIVRSIAVIPEAIVRDVYIKECGQLLRIEDKLLVSEVAKRRELQAEKGNKPIASNNAPTPQPGEMPPPFPPEEMEADTYQSFIPQEGKEGQEFYKYERLIIQMIVRYGEKVMCNLTDEEGNEVPVTVVEYVINDLKEDELAFHNPLHRRILSEASEHIHDQEFASERFFVAHPDPKISTIATELASDRYQLSKYHSKTQKLVTDEERLYEMVPMLMINFKNAIVAEELKHIMYALQDPSIANDNAQCDAVMQRYKEMKEIQNLMAKRLGDRVVLR
ncbi:DNA primase [Bacteroides fragilis]|jgi:DNA primase|uniref:DNA primase n=1 Tax=Bacteroides fragilis TaxID=817 RepID=A0AAQ2S6E0_BACFG|nr:MULTISPECIES: DNA primase [Bacteroides]EYA51515.1 DNA primase [Bacteroides fragilis str. 3986 N(B)22]MCA5602630.1 DNA primase [Bacteroides fragilis]MCE9424462.1 DNA primase [Bacteroides fragilis]MCS2227020.1 DNA primase [Bacteroides fragilis]MCS2670389.1 DNA primase [Bacteroides fragilis]